MTISGSRRIAAAALILLCACALPDDAAAARQARRSRPSAAPAPRFEDYPAREVYKGPAAPVRLDSRRARRFRTTLREESRGGPNFAGHYTVVVWGCGTGCAQMAVVDAKTGRVHFPPVEYMDIPDTENEAERARWFRLDSRLLRITQNFYDSAGRYTAYYYLFDNNRFRLLRKTVEERAPRAGEAEDQN